MQTANCHVRLSGDMQNEIFKPGVTVAEIVVLRTIHGGPEAVVKVQPTGNDKRPHAVELQRLKDIYGAKAVEGVFPGSYPQLPVNFKDIGIDAAALLAQSATKPAKGAKASKDKGAEEVEQDADTGAED